MNDRLQTLGVYLVGGLLIALGAWQVLSTLQRSPYGWVTLVGLAVVGLLAFGLWYFAKR